MFLNFQYISILLILQIVLYLYLDYNFSAVGQIDSKIINSSHSLDIFNSITQPILNFARNLEYVIEIDSTQIFPSDNVRDEVLESTKSIEYKIPSLKYELLGFQIIAKNIQVVTEPFHQYNGDINKTKINFPVMKAKNVNVKNTMLDLSYDDIDLSSTFVIYDSQQDVFSIHIPIFVAAQYLPTS